MNENPRSLDCRIQSASRAVTIADVLASGTVIIIIIIIDVTIRSTGRERKPVYQPGDWSGLSHGQTGTGACTVAR